MFIKKLLLGVLAGALVLPFGLEAKPKEDEKTKQTVLCPKCNEEVEVPKKLDKKRKSKSRFRRKGLIKCRKCNHKFQMPKPGKKTAPKKAEPKKAASEDAE